MSNIEATPDNEPDGSHMSRLESISDLGIDTEFLHTKMDTVIGLLQQMMLRFDNYKEQTNEEVSKLKRDNLHLNIKVQKAEGRITRMSRDISKLNSQCEELQLRTMNSNIVIRNLTEQHSEDIYEVVHDVFANKLKIPNNLLHSPTNPAAPVQIDVAHRIGKIGKKARPIVVKLVLRRGKDIVLNHARNLKGTTISICEQLPSEMRERRDTQLGKFKSLKEEYKNDTNMKVRLKKDKLFVNNTLIRGDFEEKPLSLTKSMNPTYFEYSDMTHTDVIEDSHSYFQGHSQTITSIPEANAAYSALLQNPDVASAHHISYAYSFASEHGITTGYNDDGETGAGKVLKMVIEQKSLENIFLAVSRHHNGPNLGRKRFDLIRSTALKVIDKQN